jgi:serine/threonine protein kinase
MTDPTRSSRSGEFDELDQDLRDPAEAAFEEFLELREQDSNADFHAFCEDRPALRDELIALEGMWGDVGGAIRRLVTVPDQPSTPLRGDSEEEEVGAILERLSQRRSPKERYRVIEEVAQGGMGVVLKVWDEDLRRELAMKVALETAPGSTSLRRGRETRSRRIARFLEEAQVTGQLDHPGILPVHEVGVDQQRRVFFTCKLVRGRGLRAVFELVREERDGWNQTRALNSLLRVCEAMAFTHLNGVVHRDLKPSNIMVGRLGETYVMDWGLARVLERGSPSPSSESDRSAAIAPTPSSSESPVPVVLRRGISSERRDATRSKSGSSLATTDGEVLGTPHYMSPEQARGELERIGPASDVYSVGAMLYELLAGRPCFPREGPEGEPRAVLKRLLAGPPAALDRVAPSQPAELVAICEKAMARDPAERYPDMSEMAEDLRAFLENRVVRAWRTGAWVELVKWVGRNRLAAAAVALLIVTIIVGSAGWVGLERARQREREDRLAANFVQEAERSWPIHPDSITSMEYWLRGARELASSLAERRAELQVLRSRGTPGPTETSESPWERQRLQAALLDDEEFARQLEVVRLEVHATLDSEESEAQARSAAEALLAEAETVAAAVEIDPCFLSKYETTQAQWTRLAGSNPSFYNAGHWHSERPKVSRRHPVENISWEDCRAMLPRWGLVLPTEAQWERAARCGEDYPFGFFINLEELPATVNCADETLHRSQPGHGYIAGRDDGWQMHAPVDEVAAGRGTTARQRRDLRPRKAILERSRRSADRVLPRRVELDQGRIEAQPGPVPHAVVRDPGPGLRHPGDNEPPCGGLGIRDDPGVRRPCTVRERARQQCSSAGNRPRRLDLDRPLPGRANHDPAWDLNSVRPGERESPEPGVAPLRRAAPSTWRPRS